MENRALDISSELSSIKDDQNGDTAESYDEKGYIDGLKLVGHHRLTFFSNVLSISQSFSMPILFPRELEFSSFST